MFGSFASFEARILVVPAFMFDIGDPQSMDGKLPSSLEKLYLLGVEVGEAGPYVRFRETTSSPKLKKVVCVPWFHYDIEEWFGRVSHKCVDYDLVGRLSLDNSERRKDGDVKGGTKSKL